MIKIQIQEKTTAVITGATAGIGKAYAYALANLGLDLVLVARRDDILRRVKQDLEAKHHIKVTILPTDLAQIDQVKALSERLSRLENLAILVNAAGFGTLGSFHNIDLQKLTSLHAVHTTAPLILAHAALQPMLQNGYGAIVNISSIEVFRVPRLGVLYTAAKQFIATLSAGLRKQVKKKGVLVQCVFPGYTRTEFHQVGDYAGKRKFSKPAYMWLRPEQVVAASLKAIERGKSKVIPGFFNKLAVGALKIPGIGAIMRHMS